MNIDKNYFLTRLSNGENIDTIGEEIAAMMNAAVEEHRIAQEAANKKAAEEACRNEKLAMAEEMINLIVDYGCLVDPDSAALLTDYDEADVAAMVDAMDQLFNMMRNLTKLKQIVVDFEPKHEKTPAKSNKTKSDDEILNDFIAKLFS
jgi:hypothetical protein